MKFPKFKKTVDSFFLDESGKISKQSVTRLGVFASGAAVATAVSSKSIVAETHCDSTVLDHANCEQMDYFKDATTKTDFAGKGWEDARKGESFEAVAHSSSHGNWGSHASDHANGTAKDDDGNVVGEEGTPYPGERHLNQLTAIRAGDNTVESTHEHAVMYSACKEFNMHANYEGHCSSSGALAILGGAIVGGAAIVGVGIAVAFTGPISLPVLAVGAGAAMMGGGMYAGFEGDDDGLIDLYEEDDGETR